MVQLSRDPERMKYIRENSERVSMNEMARLVGAPYSSIKIIAKALNLTFSHYSHNKLPTPTFSEPISQTDPPVEYKQKKRGSGHRGTYKKKVRPGPQPEKPIVRAPAIYNNTPSPYGIASDTRQL